MSRRVLLEADRLRVAYPTFDAETADLKDLVFSDEYRMTRVIESGQFAIGNDSSGFIALTEQGFSEPPRFRYAVEYDTFAGGGDSDDRDDLNQWEGLCPVFVAATPWTDAQYNNQTGFRSNTYVYTNVNGGEFRINHLNRCGTGTVYYEILEEI